MAQSVSQTILHCNHAKNTKHLSAPFQDILIIPVYHCGDGTCESSLGESPANCCYDCACKDSTSYGKTYYCDFDPDTHLGGCLPKANITLVIDSPTAPVYFSTCEMTNTVNIKAHIENQPKNAKPGHEYATLNGSAAEMFRCDKEQSLEGVYEEGGNHTFNCTLMVPRLSQCSEGRTYTYEPNSMSILISYKNGNQKTEAQTLTASLPTITTRQGIRTMYDITQEGIRKMKASLQKTMDITKEMLDAFKSCMETVKAIAYMTMIAAVVGGIYSGATAHTDTTSGDIKQGVGTATSIGKAGTKIMEAYSKMCEYLQTQYRMDLEVQKIETEMVKMEMCMEQNQHMLDVGQCDKNPQNCFTQMTSCVDFDDIDKYSKNLGRIISDGSNALGDMSDAIEEAADALEGIGGGGVEANIRILWGRQGLIENSAESGSRICDKYQKDPNGNCYTSYVKFQTYGDIKGCSGSLMVHSNSKPSSPVNLNQEIAHSLILGAGTNDMVLFCDKDKDKFYDSNEKVLDFKITLVANTGSGSATCDCGLANQVDTNAITIVKPAGDVKIGDQVRISGTAKAGAAVIVLVDGSKYGNDVTASPSGKWEASSVWVPAGQDNSETLICAQYSGGTGKSCNTVVKKKLTSSVAGTHVGEVEVPSGEGGSGKCAECPPYEYKMIEWSDNDAVSDLTARCKPGKTAFCLDEFLLVCKEIGSGYGNMWDATVYDSSSDCKSACKEKYSECLDNVQLSPSESQTVSGTVISAADSNTYPTEPACRLACTVKYKSNCQTPITCPRYGCCEQVSGSKMQCNPISGTSTGYKEVKSECCDAYSKPGFECINENYREWCPGYP